MPTMLKCVPLQSTASRSRRVGIEAEKLVHVQVQRHGVVCPPQIAQSAIVMAVNAMAQRLTY